MSDDGGAAVTQDAVGGTRLWPTLDGSLEPIVVHAAPARELAIGRDGSNFVIATLDAAGALELLRIAATGESRSRAQVGDAQIDQFVMTRRGVLALRADQTLSLIAPNGIELGRLVPPPGERIVSVLARGDHTVVLLKATTVRARPVDLDTLRWGDASPALAIDPSHVVLSPDGTHLAAGALTARIVGVPMAVSIFNLATGHRTASTCVIQTEPGEGGVLPFLPNAPIPIGFVDSKTIACFRLNTVQWWSTDGEVIPHHDSIAPTTELVAVSNGQVVTADRESLLLTTATSQQYLGYAFADANQIYPSPGGLTLAKADQVPIVLDAHLHARRRLAIPPDRQELDEVLPLDEWHALVSHSDNDGDKRRHRVSIIDTARQAVLQTVDLTSLTYDIRYEPTTHLLALTQEASIALVGLDPVTMMFGTPTEIARTGEVHLTDPELADGVIAVITRTQSGRTTIDELRRGEREPSRTYQVVGEVAAVDRAARVYVRDQEMITAYTSAATPKPRDATRGLRFAVHGRAVIRPSPDGASLLVLGDNRIRMIDVATGIERWMLPAPSAVDVDWIDNTPYTRLVGGITALDPITGKITGRACGWMFGLSPTPFDSPNDTHSACDDE